VEIQMHEFTVGVIYYLHGPALKFTIDASYFWFARIGRQLRRVVGCGEQSTHPVGPVSASAVAAHAFLTIHSRAVHRAALLVSSEET
jgi:hypothetical protein